MTLINMLTHIHKNTYLYATLDAERRGILSINKRFIHNKRATFLISYITIIYFFLRLISLDYMEFIEFIYPLAYADFIFIIAILHLVNLINVWSKNHENYEKDDAFFIEDKVFDGEIDNEAILQKLIAVVSDFKPKEAFSIGINAIWGYGKSSFLHRFKKEYKKEHSNEIVFWYRIWKNKGSSAIIENFFEELKNQLKPFSAEISDDINNYVDSILNLSNNDLKKFIISGRDLLSENKTLESYYTSIDDAIKKIDKQIIILLDDLDRLEKTEIMNTLKLIRTLSDFNNIIFIAGYDRKYIIDTIDITKNNYLDKVFNVELNLLPFEYDLIISELYKQVDIAFPKINKEKVVDGFNETFKNLFKQLSTNSPSKSNFFTSSNEDKFCINNHKLKYQDFLNTYRDVKRFINEFKFNASFLNSENDIIPQEYILLKLLTYKYRDLNILIFSKLSSFLVKSKIDEVNSNVKVFGNPLNNVFIYNSDTQEELKRLLVGYHKDDIQIIDSALCFLFREKTTEFYQTNQNSISKIYFTDIYLRNNILSGKISITQLRKVYSENNLFELTQNLSQEKNNSFHINHEIKQFIYNNSPNSRDQFIDILKTIHFILSYNNNYDNKKVIKIMSNAYNNIYNRNIRKEFLSDLFKLIENDSIGYLDMLFSEVNLNFKRLNSNHSGYNNLTKYENLELVEQDLKKFHLDKLKFLIKKNTNPNLIFKVYNLHIEAIVNDRQILHSYQSNLLLKTDIKKRFIEYFNSSLFKSIREETNENESYNGFSPNYQIAQIFSNKKTLNSLIENPLNKEFYDKFYQEGWDIFYKYLKTLSEENLKELDINIFNFSKSFINIYIINGYKALDKRQYEKVFKKKQSF